MVIRRVRRQAGPPMRYFALFVAFSPGICYNSSHYARRNARGRNHFMKHEPKPPRRKLRDLGPIIRRRPAVFAVYLVLRLIVIAVLVSSILRREYESAFICLLVLVLFMLPLSSSRTSASSCPPPWRSSFCCSSSRRRSWGSWGAISSPIPIGTPCSTPPRGSCAPPRASP